jgi:hypothetical protein
VPRIEWNVVSELPPTERGSGGFGHTGAMKGKGKEEQRTKKEE